MSTTKKTNVEVTNSESTSRPLELHDYVSVKLQDNTFFKGKISQLFEENGVQRYMVNNKSMGKSRDYAEGDKALKPLFYYNKEGKKVQLRFDEREVAALVKKLKGVEKSTGRKSEFANLTLKDFVGQKTKTQLLQGKRTNVMKNIIWTQEREVEGVLSTKSMQKEGRFQLYYDKNNDYRLSVNFEQKNRVLTIPESRYNRKFTEKEIKVLNTTGNLGLVDDFVNKNTGEIFSAFVAVDKELNSVIVRGSNSISYDKIYNTPTNVFQKKTLELGKGVILSVALKDGKKDMYVEINAAATTPDGIIKMDKERAIEKGLFQETVKKKSVDKGITV